jgi:hypothetical protein
LVFSAITAGDVESVVVVTGSFLKTGMCLSLGSLKSHLDLNARAA